jgi:type VI secretion system ImpM family protein
VLGIFGKLPKIPDFVHVRVSGQAWGGFETWLTQAVAWHEASRPASWQTLCAERRPLAFVYRPPRSTHAPEVLVGVLWPSSDVVGRRFPLVAFSRMAERDVGPEPHLLPPALTPYFEALAARGEGLGALDSVAAVDAHFRDVPDPMQGSPDLSASYANWTTVTQWADLWADLYGRVERDDVYGVLSMVVEAVRPFIGQEAPSTPLALRLPLGSAPGVNSSFWIDFLRSCARWRTTVPTMFWSLAEPRSAILLQLGDPHVSSLSELWFPDRDNDHAINLVTPIAPFGPIADQVAQIANAWLVVQALGAART